MPLYTRYPDESKKFKDYRLYYEPIEKRWHYEFYRNNSIIFSFVIMPSNMFTRSHTF